MKVEKIDRSFLIEDIKRLKSKLSKDLVILGHHYQREEVYRFADFTGDSLKLSVYAASNKSKFIVFCGVYFMAEVSNILTSNDQHTILPDLSAGCSLADMANLSKVQNSWDQLSEVFDNKKIIPITYINSSADLKSFCGQNNGIVCTSSNAQKVINWSFSQGEKIFFFPDQHLGRWTLHRMNIDPQFIKIWDPFLPRGGLSKEEVVTAKAFLWKGHCSVHQMFQPEHIHDFRSKYPNGKVISHPECSFDVCSNSDFVGSTEYIINTIKDSEPGSHWLVGTELNLVSRIANEFKPLDKVVRFMSPLICNCSTMNRISIDHLHNILKSLVDGNVQNSIVVNDNIKHYAKLSIDRMLALT